MKFDGKKKVKLNNDLLLLLLWDILPDLKSPENTDDGFKVIE